MKYMKPIEAQARFKLGMITSDAIVTLANTWLEQGIYSESLGNLFTINKPEMADVGPLFESALKKLGIPELTRPEAASLLVKITLHQIADGETNALEGAEFLYWQVHHAISDELPDNKYLGDNLGLEEVFCWLREIWDCRDGSMLLYHSDLPRDQAEAKFVEHLIESALTWKEKTALNQPSQSITTP